MNNNMHATPPVIGEENRIQSFLNQTQPNFGGNGSKHTSPASPGLRLNGQKRVLRHAMSAAPDDESTFQRRERSMSRSSGTSYSIPISKLSKLSKKVSLIQITAKLSYIRKRINQIRKEGNLMNLNRKLSLCQMKTRRVSRLWKRNSKIASANRST